MDNHGATGGWRQELMADPLFGQVLRSRPFQRLSRISFLGAIDYLPVPSRMPGWERTRARHSLGVAWLADYVCQRRRYSEELRRHVVIAALLHDIGHPPLSHSVEPHFRARFGLGHHELGEMMLHGVFRRSRKLAALLADKLDAGFIRDLVAGRVSGDSGGDLFNTPINIDTIDGIWRSAYVLTGVPDSISRLAVVEAAFLRGDDNRHAILDRFWQMKDQVYRRLINGKPGLFADHCSRRYFEEKNFPLAEDDLTCNEQDWHKRHRSLFDKLHALDMTSQTPAAMLDQSFCHVARCYYIDTERTDNLRYRVAKTSALAGAVPSM